ncbi:MAG: glycosyltransferase [bacterium]
MTDAQVTLVVVPRERFSYPSRSLESIYEHTDFPFSLIYVDGGSPVSTRRYLEQKARENNFQLIRTNHYLSPNQARNLGGKDVNSKYVVFIDNDVLVTPGWLGALVGCAEQTGAWIVGPLTLVGNPESQTIHFAGGIANIKEEHGNRVYYTEHCFDGKLFEDVASVLRPQTSELAEFHCMLMLTKAYQEVGPFDERLWSMYEHEDVCLKVRESGGTVYFEPRSVITYVPPTEFCWSDLPFFMLRWSEPWNSASQRHFQNKWGLHKNDKSLSIAREWARDHRRIPLRLVRGATRRFCRICGWQPDRIERTCIFPSEERLNRYLVGLLSTGTQHASRSTLE